MMLPLSTIGGQGREEVQTRPPQRRGETHVGRNLWSGGSGEVSRAQGRLAEHVLTIAAGSLAALSRDRIGETERKPGGEGLKANRMIYWLNRKKGGLVTGERWQEYIQGLGQLRGTRALSKGSHSQTRFLSLTGPSEGS